MFYEVTISSNFCMPEKDYRFHADDFFAHRETGSSYVKASHLEPLGTLTEIDLAEGVSVDPPPELDEIIKNLAQSGAFLDSLKHYDAVSIDPTIRNIRDRFGLSENPYVVVSGGGSHEIIERLVHLVHNPDRLQRIWGISPHFPEITNFAKRLSSAQTSSPQLIYGPMDIPLQASAEESLQIAEKRRKASHFKSLTLYVCNPTTPKGDIAPKESVTNFVEFCADKGDLVIVDEAFRPRDAYSVIPETETYPNLIVLDSFSKRGGVPGLRGGYAVMSKEIGPYYDEMRRVFDMPGPQALILNEISRPDIIIPHLERQLPNQVELKRHFVDRLDEAGLSYLTTHEEVPIITVDGGDHNFVNNLDRLNVKVAKGWGFYATEPHGGRRMPMGNRYARTSVPRTKTLINDAVHRMKAAKISTPL